jgi:hypothetical protein
MADPKSVTRTAPPNQTASNQDVFLWALYQLGGADQAVDVEDIYLRAFEIAPARLGWRTRPDIPDYKKIAKALQSVEASTHVGLVRKVDTYRRMLTPDGIAWVENYRSVLERLYGGTVAVPPPASSEAAEIISRVKESDAFIAWRVQGAVDLADAGVALGCSAASPESVWQRRCDAVIRAASLTSNTEITRFGEDMRALREAS